MNLKNDNKERGTHMRKTKDLVTGLAGMGLAIFYLLSAQSIAFFEGTGATALNSRTLPVFWGICLALLSALLLLRYFCGAKLEAPDSGEEKAAQPRKAKIAVPATFVLLALYVLLMKSVGFVLTTIVYLFLQTLVLTPKGKTRIWFAAALSAVLAVGIYLIFSRLLNVPLPAGILAF